jgi:hypothetical protein
VRHLIVSGLADPQAPGPLQAEQYDTSVAACCTLVREFVGSGYDVAVDAAVDPKGFERHLRAPLGGHRILCGGAPEPGGRARTGRGQIQTGTAGPGPRAARRGLAVANPANHGHYWPQSVEESLQNARRLIADGP